MMNNNISMEKRLPVAGIFSYNVYGVAYQLQDNGLKGEQDV